MRMVRFILLLSLGLSTSAWGRKIEAEGTSQARELYREATSSYKLGEFSSALEKYKAAFRLKPDPAFLFNIAQCHRQLGQPEDAAREYRAYLRDSPDAPNRFDVQELIVEMDRAVAARAKPPLAVQSPPDLSRTDSTTQPPAAAPEKRSRKWMWLGIGGAAVVVAGVGVGLGVGLSQQASAPDSSLGTFSPSWK